MTYHFILDEPVTHDWVPPVEMSQFKKLAFQFMALMDEAKTPRSYQRDIVKVLNQLLALPVTDEGNSI